MRREKVLCQNVNRCGILPLADGRDSEKHGDGGWFRDGNCPLPHGRGSEKTTLRLGFVKIARISALAVSLLAVTVVQGQVNEALKRAEDDIVKKVGKLKSMSARLTVTATVRDEGMEIESTQAGSYEMVRDGSKTKYRRETTIKSVQRIEGEEEKIEQRELVVCDGDYVYSLTDSLGVPTATKNKVDRRLSGRINRNMFWRWHKAYDLKLLPDAEVDGIKTYVFEARPKVKNGALPARSLYYFSKDYGFLVKTVFENDKGEPTEVTQYTDVTFNADIDPKRFKFEAPEGVEIEDRTLPPLKGASRRP